MQKNKYLIFPLVILSFLFISSPVFAEPKEVPSDTQGEDIFRIEIFKPNGSIGQNAEEKFFQDGVPVRWLFENRTEGLKVIWDHQNKVAKVCRNGQELLFTCSNKEIQLKENQFLMPKKYVIFHNGKTYFIPFWLQSIYNMTFK